MAFARNNSVSIKSDLSLQPESDQDAFRADNQPAAL
jgi:hypothetical protein